MTLNDKAIALLNQGKVLEAIPILRDLSWREPSYKAYVNLASALRYAGDFDSAIQYLTRAVKLDASSPHAWMSLANLSTDVGDWEHALKYYEGALFRISQVARHDGPEGVNERAYRQIALGFAQALLRVHQFHTAWPLWEFGRFGYSYSELPGTQRWLGEPCDSLLVICEGGYGDGMLFGRWLPFAKTRAKHVKLVIWDRMVGFRSWWSRGVDEVIPKSAEIDPTGIQYTTSWMSLPGIAGMRSVADIPKDITFDKWPDCLELGSSRVGLCWRAEENSTIRRIRSLCCGEAEALATRLAVHGEVISLCPLGKQLIKPDAEPWPGNVLQDEALLDDWDRTAQTIRSCKFVVTVDTAVAHLAGLCGVPTLLLLPVASDWKWGMSSNQSEDPWYGPHVHYYRNTDPLSWNAENIALAAGNLVGACTTHL